MTADQQQSTGSDTTDAWLVADRAHLERLIAATDTPPKRPWWKPRPLPWLVVRQYQRKEHVVSMHRWDWRAEMRAIHREGCHRSEVGVFYTARHSTEIRKTPGAAS